MSSLSELRDSRELLVNLTMREVRSKYKRTALGQGWSLLNPLANLAIFTLVFGVLLGAKPPAGDPSGIDVFALWLATGLLPWTFFSGAMSAGMQSLLINANLMKKVYFPRELLVGSTVFSFVVTFAIELGVLTVLLLLFGANPLLWLPLVVVAVALLTIFALGLSLVLAIGNVYFRDTSYLVALGLQLWFYLTPIVYPASLVKDKIAARGSSLPLETLYGMNPMERFVGLFRALLYDNRMPDWQDWLGAGLSAAISLAVGAFVFRRFSARLVEEL
ncbi:MAG: ABC transporter permease [Frankiales bacterium]|nr:ABC transporter permease [Frankiales bacterium]